MRNEKSAKSTGITVESIMTDNVISVTSEMTVGEAINLFLKMNISGAPLVNPRNIVISVVSEADLMKFAIMGELDIPIKYYLDKLVTIDEIVAVTKNDSFKTVFSQFIQKPVRRVIVIDSTGCLQGIVSRKNILKVFSQTKTNDPES